MQGLREASVLRYDHVMLFKHRSNILLKLSCVVSVHFYMISSTK